MLILERLSPLSLPASGLFRKMPALGRLETSPSSSPTSSFLLHRFLMITCPNCNHQNPDGAQQCEACYTPLPAMVACPNCGAPVQENASFCGQCGSDLRGLSGSSGAPAPAVASTDISASIPESSIPTENFLNKGGSSGSGGGSSVGGSSVGGSSVGSSSSGGSDFELPDLVVPDPLIIPDPITPQVEASESSEAPASPAASAPEAAVPEAASQASAPEVSSPAMPSPAAPPIPSTPPIPPAPPTPPAATQLQVITVRLRHVQTDTLIEIPGQLSVVRIGKPNDQTPPDIDVSGFSDSEVVSRVHANLRVEGDVYYLEDVGSSNGTYVNGLPLAVGNRHRLRAGDRIALGKGDKVSFMFETA